jgi:ABC-2 type transport system permease protein
MLMLSASLYIIVCSARNRIRQRLSRLRQPRYLIGAVVGVAYLYFSFFARFRMSRTGTPRRRAGRTPPPLVVLSAMRSGAPGVIGIALLAMTAVGWLLPFDSGLLDFSEAEIQFLFPAPVSRRGLLIHRLLRSQLGLLFGSVIASLVAPSTSGSARLRIGVATWLVLSTAKVYFTGISLARARLGSGDARIRRVAWLPLVTLAAALAVVGVAIGRAFGGAAPDSIQDVVIRVGQVTTTGLSSIVLWPFIALARPLFAPWPWPYLTALGWAGAVLLATILWVLQSDAAFEDAAAMIAQRKAQAPKKDVVRYHVRSSALPLAVHGRPEMAFAWKAATQTMRIFGKRNMLRLAVIVFALTIIAMSMGRSGGLATVVGSFALATCIFAVTLAPQALRVDMREDLQHLDTLKTWPIGAAAVVRGELLWPGVLLTALAWTALAITELLTAGTALGDVSLSWRLSAGAAFAVLAPALVFAQLTIHNAAALIFPAWVPQGYQRPRGLDALGQRLIMLFGTWLALIVSALPGAIVGGIVGFAFWRLLGPAAVIPGALVCSAIMAMEVLLATEALGPAYERLDITAVERAE